MQFDSITYALFLPLVFVLYWLLRNHLKAQNWLLVISSYVMYGWWDWRFLGLIAFTSASTFVTALLMERCRRRGAKKAWLVTNLVLNLGVLATFKYLGFFVESATSLLLSMGITPHWGTVHLLLPVGISFFTLQAVSYTIDVYRGDVKSTRDVVAFFAFISFFPQLVAGPIERAKNLLPQMLNRRRWSYEEAVVGMRQILWGVAKKVLVADVMATYVDYIFYNPPAMSPWSILLASGLAAVQVYADFSSYSDIAIGSARLMGIKLKANFRYPFFTRDIRELWQQWHISLMTWLRDYLYIPLGGSRRGTARRYINVMIVFAVSGLWHGAAWTFVLWGVLNGVAVVLATMAHRKLKRQDYATLRQLPLCLLSFATFAVLFMVFRANNMFHLGECLNVIAHGDYSQGCYGLGSLRYVAPFFVVEWLGRKEEFPLKRLAMPAVARWAIYWTLLVLIVYFSTGNDIKYIYFQF